MHLTEFSSILSYVLLIGYHGMNKTACFSFVMWILDLVVCEWLLLNFRKRSICQRIKQTGEVKWGKPFVVHVKKGLQCKELRRAEVVVESEKDNVC